MYLEEYKANHFAKHLVDRELNKKNIPTNNVAERARLLKMCFTDEAPISTLEAMQVEEKKKSEEPEESPVTSETSQGEPFPPKRKAGRPKKVELPPASETPSN